MPHPEKGGQITEYEEIWRNVVPRPGGKKAWIIESDDDAGGKCFLGKIGGTFLAVSEGKKGYGARSEEWGVDEKKWKVKYEIGDVVGVPSFAAVDKDAFEGEESWEVGEKVDVQARKFVVLALKDL